MSLFFVVTLRAYFGVVEEVALARQRISADGASVGPHFSEQAQHVNHSFPIRLLGFIIKHFIHFV
jgi:hypothetical protein